MSRLVYTLAALLLLSQACHADLSELLKWQRLGDPGAYVSSGFHDWRTVSKYRRRAGLHAGYDIAMWADTPVRAAWPGRVVAITPWYGREYGVSVLGGGGYEATYGHISPTVAVGQELKVGDIVGYVVVDHVDVKMRDRVGRFVDFQFLDLPKPSASPAVVETPAEDLEALQRLKEKREAMKSERKQLLQQRARLSAKVDLGLRPRTELEQLDERLRVLSSALGPADKEGSDGIEELELDDLENQRQSSDKLVRAKEELDLRLTR